MRHWRETPADRRAAAFRTYGPRVKLAIFIVGPFLIWCAALALWAVFK